VKFAEPGAGFKRTTVETADAAWIDSKRGTTISFQSSCDEPAESSLDSIIMSSTEEILEKEFLSKTNLIYNERMAIRANIAGHVDGVPILVDVVVFKKNACNYFISYVALKEHHKKDLNTFEYFIRSFKAE
jgi:hypothetical protein